MSLPLKSKLKGLLADVPYTVELYWFLRNRTRPMGRFKLSSLQSALPEAVAQAKPYAQAAYAQATPAGKNIFIFATLHYWIEHAALMGIALAGQGHKVTLGYLPYGDWQKPLSRFDLRQQNVYARSVLTNAAPLLKSVSLMDVRSPNATLPAELESAVKHVSEYDAQYTLQVEDVDTNHPVYLLRLERNLEAARSALLWFKSHRTDVVIVPNGTIQEFGVIYQVAKYLSIPVVTYEFGDQRERIWLAQNAEIMRQDTGEMWQARSELPIDDERMSRLRDMFAARQKAVTWQNFARKWQAVSIQGGEQVREALGLDNRPVVLLATNVLGDSLTLGRQVFSQSMAEWIVRTVKYFADHSEAQLVIRVHPGELLMHGTSMMDVVKEAMPELPEHIHLIAPGEKVNTYDVVAVADLGLVYTTTVGMEMAMNGIPVVVAGQTHYRDRGFTEDPSTWEQYFNTLDRLLQNPAAYRLSPEEVDRAWQYAYRFFFEYPHEFPWHLVHVWDDYKERPMSLVLSPEGQARYAETFRYLTGEPVDWARKG